MSSTTSPRSWQPVDVGLPGPTPRDMARAFLSIRADPLSYLTRIRGDYGDTVAFPVPGPPAVLVNDPDDVRRVLQTDARHWSKHTVQYRALARVTGPGLLASAEPGWITHRRVAAPAFGPQRLERVGDQVRAAVDDNLAAWLGPDGPTAPGAARDVMALTTRIGLDAVGRALFSADLSPRAQQLLQASGRASEMVVRSGRAIIALPSWAPTPTNLRLRATTRRLAAASDGLIEQRRRIRRAERHPTPDSQDDLLGLLVDSGMDDEQIRSELVTMIIAGHETVAASLAWTLMLVAQHPDVQDRVRAELGAGDPAGMLDHRSRFPYTRAVLDEALRLYPPAWVVSRRAEGAATLGGREVPPGTTAIISPWLLHRGPPWPDPATFRPERFLDVASSRPTGYLPFGQGPRLCIGREFALGEMVITLDRLLRTHRVSLPPQWSPPRPQAQVAIHPHAGMPLVLTRHDPGPA